MEPPSGSLATVFSVDAENSDDDDGTVASYRWDWGMAQQETEKSLRISTLS